MKLPRLPLVIFAALVSLAPLVAGDKKNVPQSSVDFVVLKDDTGKPIRNAAVVLHPLDKHGKQAKTGFELKTDPDGKTHFDGVPYGPWRVQALAPGFQTFGDNVEIGQPTQEITIRLKRPQPQYSIYDKPGAEGSPTPK